MLFKKIFCYGLWLGKVCCDFLNNIINLSSLI